MVVPPTARTILRQLLRERRHAAAMRTGPARFGLHPQFQNVIQRAAIIGLYLPMAGEPDPWPLVADYSGRTALPALVKGLPMQFHMWSSGDPLVASSWGGEQPSDMSEYSVPDLIIVPLLGFDAAFNRLGQGGGHYDRYLAAHPKALRIGIAWEAQRVDRIDAQPWDIPMDAMLTETDFYIKDLTRCQRL